MTSRRILLVGRAESSHVLRWAELCEDLGFVVRRFEPDGPQWVLRGIGEATDAVFQAQREAVLVECMGAISAFAPDIVHACGLDPYGIVVADVLDRLAPSGSARRPAFAVQARGGHELMLAARAPRLAAAYSVVLAAADGLITDHDRNFDICLSMGLSIRAAARRTAPLPGGGGLSREEIATYKITKCATPTVLWPKAYLAVGVDGLCIAEGLRRSFSKGRAFDLRLLFCFQEDFRLMLDRLWPKAMRARVRIDAAVPWSIAMRHIAEASVMLAPSLLDGIPNVLIEAMALGTIPIVSDHGFFPRSWHEAPALRFAPNLDPDAIATAILDVLDADPARVAEETRSNIARAFAHADRALVASRLRFFYDSL